MDARGMIRDYEPSLPRGGRAALEEYFKERFSVTGFRFAFTSRTSNWLETWHSSGWRIAPSFGQPEKPSRSKMPGRGCTSTNASRTDCGSLRWIFGIAIDR